MAAALVLQTHDDRPPGLVGAWACARGVALDVIRADRWSRLPDPSGYRFAVALGSDVSLADPCPEWVANELDWIRRADGLGVPVLGICFGAQALAVALGGSVQRGRGHGFAWIATEAGGSGLVPAGLWLTARRDAITAPSGADELALGDAGPLAFAIGRHLGLRFHPEATPALLARWLDGPGSACGRAALLARAREHRAAITTAAVELLDAFAARAGVRSQASRPAMPAHAGAQECSTPTDLHAIEPAGQTRQRGTHDGASAWRHRTGLRGADL